MTSSKKLYEHQNKQNLKWIRVGDMCVKWSLAQQPFDQKWAETIGTNLDPDMIGIIVVTLPDKNGVHHIIDGQHRVGGVRWAWGEDQKLLCQIIDCNDPKRAAQIYNAMQTAKKTPHPVSLFNIRVTAEETTEVAVNGIVTGLGYKIEASMQEGCIRAVGALVNVYEKHGGEILRDTLLILRGTWGIEKNSVEASLLKGYARFLSAYGKGVDRQRLVDTVQKKFTPGQLIGAGKQHKEMYRGSIGANICRVLVLTYDAGLRKNKLGDMDVAA